MPSSTHSQTCSEYSNKIEEPEKMKESINILNRLKCTTLQFEQFSAFSFSLHYTNHQTRLSALVVNVEDGVFQEIVCAGRENKIKWQRKFISSLWSHSITAHGRPITATIDGVSLKCGRVRRVLKAECRRCDSNKWMIGLVRQYLVSADGST